MIWRRNRCKTSRSPRWRTGLPERPARNRGHPHDLVMRSSLFNHEERSVEPGGFQLQNERMLKVDLTGSGGFFFAKQGSMVAYQGDVHFAYEGAGGIGKLFKK